MCDRNCAGCPYYQEIITYSSGAHDHVCTKWVSTTITKQE